MSHLSRRTFLYAASAGALSVGSAARGNQTVPSVREITDRVSRYVAWYDQQLTAVVAEERYSQEMTQLGVGRLTRELVSEVAWVRLAGAADAIAVRDVLAVDGRPLGRERRLPALLENADTAVESAVAALLAESAAHNLGADARNINFPTFPLVYLRARYLRASRWRVRRGDGHVLVLEFDERQRPTIVKSPGGANLPGQGRFWIDEGSGRVERCEMRVEFARVTESFRHSVVTNASDQCAVEFREEQALGLWVPATMSDMFSRGQGREAVQVSGEATYSNYRRFETTGRVISGAR